MDSSSTRAVLEALLAPAAPEDLDQQPFIQVQISELKKERDSLDDALRVEMEALVAADRTEGFVSVADIPWMLHEENNVKLVVHVRAMGTRFFPVAGQRSLFVVGPKGRKIDKDLTIRASSVASRETMKRLGLHVAAHLLGVTPEQVTHQLDSSSPLPSSQVVSFTNIPLHMLVPPNSLSNMVFRPSPPNVVDGQVDNHKRKRKTSSSADTTLLPRTGSTSSMALTTTTGKPVTVLDRDVSSSPIPLVQVRKRSRPKRSTTTIPSRSQASTPPSPSSSPPSTAITPPSLLATPSGTSALTNPVASTTLSAQPSPGRDQQPIMQQLQQHPRDVDASFHYQNPAQWPNNLPQQAIYVNPSYMSAAGPYVTSAAMASYVQSLHPSLQANAAAGYVDPSSSSYLTGASPYTAATNMHATQYMQQSHPSSTSLFAPTTFRLPDNELNVVMQPDRIAPPHLVTAMTPVMVQNGSVILVPIQGPHHHHHQQQPLPPPPPGPHSFFHPQQRHS